ncbi:MAG: protein tyrosine/serine phosphatase [Phenylobacterium sp.]|nr:protein tyrosine/serine phosphatase [Phenylobacterium sp.]
MRHVPLAGASNFRDFGGYQGRAGRRVRLGKLYRSDRLSGLTDADFAALAPRGIRLICDLRRQTEVDGAPTRWPGEDAPEILAAPLFPDEAGPSTMQRVLGDPAARNDPAQSRQFMLDLYRRLIAEPAPRAAYHAIFARLAMDQALPVLVHCSAGKDRTGVVCALLHGLLGVSREDIVEDFLLTQRYYEGAREIDRRIPQIVGAEFTDWSLEALIPIFSVEAAYIEAALDALETEHGSAEAFLSGAVGLPQATLDRIKDALLA